LPELRPAVTGWQAAATRVLSRLLRAFASSLGQSEDALEHLYRDSPHILIKLICYPGREHTGSDQGVGAHKDSGLLSLLLQDEQGGLQVETTLLREVGQNYLKGRLRSHPDVARRHFADLIHPGAPVEAFSGY
jgi:isopenicillin N synthase-like dioxygenase